MPRTPHRTQPVRRPAGRRFLHVLLALALVLTGCAGPQEPAAPAATPVEPLAQAEQLETAGDLRGAAHAYSTLALDAAPPVHQDLQLRAIDALARAGDTGQARALLDKVQTAGLDPQYEQRRRLLGARIALAERESYAALEWLPAVPADVPRALQVEQHTARAQAYELSGNALENARERSRLDPLLDAPAQRTNHRALWAALATLSNDALAQLRTAPPPDPLSGWMELASLARAPDKATLPQRVDAWRQRYPGHPAETDIVVDLIGAPQPAVAPLPGGAGYPQRIAVLLPLSGQYAQEALAVRNGLLVAYYRQRWGGTAPQLRFYDTNAADSGLRRYYDQAVADGAGLVIGPLTKPAVADLARSGPFTVPVLALNQSEGAVPARFYQFALSPEDEARQAAERASLDGHARAVALVPAGDWGTRLLQAFTQRFQELGGTITGVERYGANSDVQTLLDRLLARSPDAPAPSPADMLFLVAFPDQARRIAGDLGGLSVYATSHVFTGRAGTTGPEGLIFSDMPWMLSPESLAGLERTRSAQLWPESLAANPRLYGLGIDAYNIVPYLERLGNSPTTGYPGETGRLYRDASGRLHRQLVWARYSHGEAQPLGNAPLSWTPPAR